MIEHPTDAIDLAALDTLPPAAPPARPWLITFVNLVCVLLSFFVLLANISTIERSKARDAIRSLGQTLAFGTESGARKDRPAEAEAIIGPKLVRQRLAATIRAIFPDAKMKDIAARDELRFALPLHAVFAGAALKPEAGPMLAAVAAALKRGAPGFRLEADAMAGAGSNPADAVARAALLARGLVEGGAPKTAVAAGVDRGTPDEIRFAIRAKPEDAPRIDFRRIAPQP